MTNSTRRISMILAVVIVLGLFAAFPMLSAMADDPAVSNIAPQAQYKGEGEDNGSTGNYCEAPGTDWEVYHSGKLNDGIIPTGDSEATKGQNVEFWLSGIASGTIHIYFKFNAVATVSEANVYMNWRESTGGNRGYPESLKVYVGSGEDVAAATLLGEATTTDPEGAVRKYSVSGEAIDGSYVILEMVTPTTLPALCCSEVEIFGTLGEPFESSEESSEEESSVEDSTESEPSDEIEIDVPLENVAKDAQYKGTEGDDNGTSGNYCDTPIGEWLNYHSGKLIDGIIPNDNAANTKGQNVEIWNGSQSAGNNTVIFKLAESADLKQVNVYMNNRTDNANTGYPEKIEIYVGDSEDMAAATLMGEAKTSDPEGAVRKYTVNADISGSYVFIYFTVGAKWRITLSEVEIMTAAPMKDYAPDAQYKGTEGDDNGTSGNYCDTPIGEWLNYHSGKLNDGIVPDGDSEATKGQNVEFWNDGNKAGNNTIIFKLDRTVNVRELNVYMNSRASNAACGYPTKIEIYVGADEDMANATLLGEATTTDPEGAIRLYNAKGNATGSYVFLYFTIGDLWRITCSEVNIMGYHVVPKLPAPSLSGNLDRMETFEAPVITWEAVAGAVGYDAYINGILAAEGITETTYTPDMDPVVAYGSNTSYTKVQIVAKGDGDFYGDSVLSDSYNFFYVEKPLDLRGNRVTSADILIDPGHGGSQPGACLPLEDGTERQEKDDTLAMSLKLGETLEKLGYTVAFCRIEDVDDGLMSRAAKANAGDFDLFICVHRNAFNGQAKGIETLYEAGDDTDKAFAQAVQDQLAALNLTNNRGLKPRDNLVVTNNVADTIPCILVELAFIDNVDDNKAFDENFDAIALAIAKGAMVYQGKKIDNVGTVKVGDDEYNYEGAEIVVNIEAVVGEDKSVEISYELAGALGIASLNRIDGDVVTALGYQDATAPEGYKTAYKGAYTLELSAAEAGTQTMSLQLVDDFGGKSTVLTVNVYYVVKHTVTFVGMDGTTIETQSVKDGEAAIAPNAPEVEGYTFTGWDKAFDAVTEDMTVTAQYTKNEEDSSEAESTVDSSEAESTVDSSEAESTVDSSEAESESEADSSEPESDTPNTGDAGMAVFAILAVIAMAGVVVAKKSK